MCGLLVVELLDDARETIHILKNENLNLVSALDHKSDKYEELMHHVEVSFHFLSITHY